MTTAGGAAVPDPRRHTPRRARNRRMRRGCPARCSCRTRLRRLRHLINHHETGRKGTTLGPCSTTDLGWRGAGTTRVSRVRLSDSPSGPASSLLGTFPCTQQGTFPRTPTPGVPLSARRSKANSRSPHIKRPEDSVAYGASSSAWSCGARYFSGIAVSTSEAPLLPVFWRAWREITSPAFS